MTQREPDRYLLRCPRWSLGCGCGCGCGGCGCGGGARVKRGRSSNTPSIHVPRFARVCEWCARACAVKSSGAAPVHQGPQFMHLGVCTPKPPRPLGRWIAPALPGPTTRESRYPQPDPLGICTPICCVGPLQLRYPFGVPAPTPRVSRHAVWPTYPPSSLSPSAASTNVPRTRFASANPLANDSANVCWLRVWRDLASAWALPLLQSAPTRSHLPPTPAHHPPTA